MKNILKKPTKGGTYRLTLNDKEALKEAYSFESYIKILTKILNEN